MTTRYVVRIKPISIKKANVFTRSFHRHSDDVNVGKFAIAFLIEGEMVGVVVCGIPIARELDDGVTLEVLRACSKDSRVSNSKMLARAKRAGQALGFNRFVTYTRPHESGASLRGVGAKFDGMTRGKSWSNRKGRRCRPAAEGAKLRWFL
jgi:hypothetical protein